MIKYLLLLIVFIPSVNADEILNRVGPSAPDGSFFLSTGEIAKKPVRRAEYAGTIVNVSREHKLTKLQFYYTLRSFFRNINGTEPERIREAEQLAKSLLKVNISVFPYNQSTSEFNIIPSKVVEADLIGESYKWRGLLYNNAPLFNGEVDVSKLNINIPAGLSIIGISWGKNIGNIVFSSQYLNSEYYQKADPHFGLVWSNYGYPNNRSARILSLPSPDIAVWRELRVEYENDFAVNIHGKPLEY